MTPANPISDPLVLSAFNAFPKEIKAELLKLRAIQKLPEAELSLCIKAALTYHQRIAD
jgi:hypothetical protein